MILECIRDKKNYTSSENVLAKYIIDNPQYVSSLNQYELAKKAFVSAPTVSRFCKKIGFKNYEDFIRRLIKELEVVEQNPVDVNYPFNKGDNLRDIVSEIYSAHVGAMHSFVEHLNVELLEIIISEIIQKKSVDIYGMGSTIVPAYQFSDYMCRIGYPTWVHEHFSTSYLSKLSIESNHFKIFISHSGKLKESVEFCREMNDRNIDFLYITANKFSEICNYSKYTYILETNEELAVSGKIGAFASQAMLTFVLDTIYAGVFEKNYEQSLHNLKKASYYQTKNFVTNFQ